MAEFNEYLHTSEEGEKINKYKYWTQKWAISPFLSRER